MKKVSILIAFILASAICFGQKNKKEKADTVAAPVNTITLTMTDDFATALFQLLSIAKFDGMTQGDMAQTVLIIQNLRNQAQAQVDARAKPKK